MKYSGVLFDLGGTMLNTLNDIAEAANYVLADFNLPGYEVNKYKYFVGDGFKTLVTRILPEHYRSEGLVNKITVRVEEEYSRRWVNNTRPYPGIPGLLNALTNLGIRMAILSNMAQNSLEAMVSKLLSTWRFEVILGASPFIPNKPDPKGALQIAQQMNMKSSEFLYLGDSAIDMKTAAAAKMYPVGALWGYRTSDELILNGAKAIAQRPLDILALLND